MSVSPKWFFPSGFLPPEKRCRFASTRDVGNSNVCSEIGCLKAWVHKFYGEGAHPLLRNCSRAARVRSTSGTPKSLNYCVIVLLYA